MDSLLVHGVAFYLPSLPLDPSAVEHFHHSLHSLVAMARH